MRSLRAADSAMFGIRANFPQRMIRNKEADGTPDMLPVSSDANIVFINWISQYKSEKHQTYSNNYPWNNQWILSIHPDPLSDGLVEAKPVRACQGATNERTRNNVSFHSCSDRMWNSQSHSTESMGESVLPIGAERSTIRIESTPNLKRNEAFVQHWDEHAICQDTQKNNWVLHLLNTTNRNQFHDVLALLVLLDTSGYPRCRKQIHDVINPSQRFETLGWTIEPPHGRWPSWPAGTLIVPSHMPMLTIIVDT